MSRHRFSRRTVIVAIETMERLTKAKLTRTILKLGPDYAGLVGGEGISVSKRLNNLVRIIDEAPDRRIESGELLRDALVEGAIALIPKPRPVTAWSSELAAPPNDVVAFEHALELDGFIVREGVLARALPADLGIPAVLDEISRLLSRYQFTTALGHLEQALDAHARGRWAGANSQIRTFFDALTAIVLRHNLTRVMPI